MVRAAMVVGYPAIDSTVTGSPDFGMISWSMIGRLGEMGESVLPDLFGWAEQQERRVLTPEEKAAERKAKKKAYDAARYPLIREKKVAQANQYYADHKEEVLVQRKVFYADNKDVILSRQAELRRQHIAEDPTYRERENAQGRKQRAANPGLYRAINKRAKARIRERDPGRNARAMLKRYWADPVNARIRGLVDANNRRARLLAAPGDITLADIETIRRRQHGKCAWCLKPLGKETPHLDHYVPLARGGTNEMHNLRLLHRLCNMQKHAKHPLDFGLEHGLLLW